MENKMTQEELKDIEQKVEMLRPYFIYVLIKNIIEKKVIKLTYKKEDKKLTKFFELKDDVSSSFYSDEQKTITLYSFFEDVYETINFKDIVRYEYTHDSVEEDPTFKQRHKLKECYQFVKEKIKEINYDYDADSLFFSSNFFRLQDLPYIISLKITDNEEYYNPTPEQFNKHRKEMLRMLSEEVVKQKEIITEEFKMLQRENENLEEDELQSILVFIEEIKQNTTFEDCNKLIEMFQSWPTILTSPVATWNHECPWI